jgi:hypothetical protein
VGPETIADRLRSKKGAPIASPASLAPVPSPAQAARRSPRRKIAEDLREEDSEEEEEEEEKDAQQNHHHQRSRRPKGFRVEKLDTTTGRVLGTFPTQRAAAQSVGVGEMEIGRCVRGNKTEVGGFAWRRVAEEQEED